MGKHSLEDSGSFWRSLVLFVLKWVGIAVLPALAVFGIISLLTQSASDGEPQAQPTVEATFSPSPSPSPSPAPSPTPEPSPTPKGPVQVLNGTTTRGLAASAAEELEQAGYEIAGLGNAASQYERTTVFFQPGHEALANEIAAFLGADVIEPAPDSLQNEIPVTVVLGDDFEA